MTQPLDYTDHDTRLAGYALVRDEQGRILLSRWVGQHAPSWTCPGGGIDYGEQIPDMAGWFTPDEIRDLPHVSTVDHLLTLSETRA